MHACVCLCLRRGVGGWRGNCACLWACVWTRVFLWLRICIPGTSLCNIQEFCMSQAHLIECVCLCLCVCYTTLASHTHTHTHTHTLTHSSNSPEGNSSSFPDVNNGWGSSGGLVPSFGLPFLQVCVCLCANMHVCLWTCIYVCLCAIM